MVTGAEGPGSGLWQEELTRIEEQHESLLAGTQAWLAALGDRRPDAEVSLALRQLIDLLDIHFRTEEHLMGRVDYPEQHAHRLLHLACLQQFRQELGHLELGTRRALEQYREMIQVWIRDHLDRQDRRFDTYLQHHRSR